MPARLTVLSGRVADALPSLVQPGRVPGLRTAKATLAAVLSFVLAQQLGTSPEPVLAPLTALLVVQLTAYETVTSGLERVVSVLAGVLVAVGLAPLAGLTWLSLGVAVLLSLVLGRLLRLGANLLEVPISAMIVLAVGGDPAQAEGRVVETLLGAAVGVVVTLAVAPPLHVRPAADALGELADRAGRVLRGLADELRGEWTRESADRWLQAARGLAPHVARADRVLARAEESGRYNPRGSVARAAQPRLRAAHSGMEHAYVALRSLCRALLDRTYFVPDPADAYSPAARAALADVLDDVADTLQLVGAHSAAAGPHRDDEQARARLAAHLRELREGRDRLTALLLVDPAHDEAAWQQHGALLAGLDRLRVELEATMTPLEQAWTAGSAATDGGPASGGHAAPGAPGSAAARPRPRAALRRVLVSARAPQRAAPSRSDGSGAPVSGPGNGRPIR